MLLSQQAYSAKFFLEKLLVEP